MFFSKIKKENKRIVKIFGIKFVYKRKKSKAKKQIIPVLGVDHYFWECWQTPTNDKSYEYFYQRYAILLSVQSSDVRYSENYRKLALVFAQSYFEDGAYSCAVPLIKGYINYWGMRDIDHFLLVSDKLSEIMECDEKVKKSADFYKKVFRDDTLLELLKGKSVAVVGNGPSEIGKGNGKEIDKHDIVIRFNAFKMDENISVDYGTKTDVWYWAFSPQYDLKKDLKDLKMIIIGPDILHSEFKYGYIDFIEELAAVHDVPLFSIDTEYRKKLRSETQITYPSSGFLLLKYLLDHRDLIADLSVYGFTFNDESDANAIYQRYFDRREEVFMGHNFTKEAKLIRQCFDNFKRKL